MSSSSAATIEDQYEDNPKANQEDGSVVGDFWLDGDLWNQHTDQETYTSYRIRTFTNEPPTPFFKRNKGLARELFFFLCLLIVGSIIIGYHWSLIDRNEFLASVFFASGFIPGLQLVLFDVLPRAFKKYNTTDPEFATAEQDLTKPEPTAATTYLAAFSFIKMDDFLSFALSAAFLGVAMIVYPVPEAREDRWDIVTGKTLFEAGLIYFVTRVLFFVPNPVDEVRELKSEIQQLKNSMAIGLADGYFWNLVKEIAIDIRDANGPQNSLKLKFPRGQGDTYKMVKQFLIIIPRELDWSAEDPIADFINGKKKEGHFCDCQIEKSPNREYSSRVKWVTDVILDKEGETNNTNNTDDKNSELEGEILKEGIVIDIPTTITAILMNFKAEYGESENIIKKSFQHEINTFSYRIAWQLKKQNLEKYVAVVEVDNTADLLEKIQNINTSLE